MTKKGIRLKDGKKHSAPGPGGLFDLYQTTASTYDELIGALSEHLEFKQIFDFFNTMDPTEFLLLHNRAQEAMKERGVTFQIHTNNEKHDHTFPFDLIPRVIERKEWEKINDGVKQRVTALNEFLLDIYSQEHVLRDGIIPRDLVFSSSGYNAKLHGVVPPGGIYLHISGIDIVRDHHGKLLVLEDNLRVPSGISYAIENRQLMKRFFNSIFQKVPVRTIENYTKYLHRSLCSIKTPLLQGNNLALLTPGPFNSAYFEHQFLAQGLNCPLVQGHDLFVENDFVYRKNEKSSERIDILYRRIDDDFLDPRAFNPESLIGVPGLFNAYVKGNVMLANALGNGVADDKSIFPYVPKLIRYYLNEAPLLEQVTTYSCINKKEQEYVLNNLSSLVLKLVDKSGGYGMLMGPEANKEQLIQAKQNILANARSYIAQPLIELSSSPTFNPSTNTLCSRRLDLRPYCLMGNEVWLAPGGLTRVALKHGSYIVNSSQGGGSKDTWVLD